MLDLAQLHLYYESLFPIDLLVEWLSKGTRTEAIMIEFSFAKRELSYTLSNDVYLRYKSFDNASSFRSDVVKNRPLKIDIGSVYSVKPSTKKSLADAQFYPIAREVVFDVDLSDYDDLRTCCQYIAVSYTPTIGASSSAKSVGGSWSPP